MGKEILEKETQVSNAPEIKLNFSTYQPKDIKLEDISETEHLTWWTKSVSEFKETFGLASLDSRIATKSGKPFLLCMNSKGESADMFISASENVKKNGFDAGFNVSLRCGLAKDADGNLTGELSNYFLAVSLPKESVSKSY